jgi:DNA mismatch repair protein MutL
VSPSVIRPLDPATITKIAAGEVIERPSSIVKELVENALDAGAGRCECAVRSRAGAVESIRVTDDGAGMSAEDLRLAVLPHTTSKLRDVEDLASVTTMGFRGEALASIAAIARLTIVSRKPGELLASRIVVAGGTVEETGEAPGPVGTSVTVEDLFFNTPARKKFQKSLGTELAHIVGAVERIALARPEIAFSLTHNGRTRLSTPGAGLADAIASLLGPEIGTGLLQVEAERSLCRVSGYLAGPTVQRPNPYQIFVAVNGRTVQSPALSAAVRSGFGTLLPGDRFPVAAIEIEIDTTLVDVNVHPTKRQVRLSHEPEVLAAVSEAVADALASLRPTTLPAASISQAREPVAAPPVYVVAEPVPSYRVRTDRQLRQTTFEEPASAPGVELLGQVGLTYLVGRTHNGELVLIDQHAAHERVLYEQLLGRDRRGTQELLVPAVMACTPREQAVLEGARETLREAGFECEEFGEGQVAIRTVPVVLGHELPAETVREVVAELIGGEAGGPDAREQIVRLVACHGAIRAGAVLSREQGERLIAQLYATRTPLTCPHGRPTVVAFSPGRLEALFSRR